MVLPKHAYRAISSYKPDDVNPFFKQYPKVSCVMVTPEIQLSHSPELSAIVIMPSRLLNSEYFESSCILSDSARLYKLSGSGHLTHFLLLELVALMSFLWLQFCSDVLLSVISTIFLLAVELRFLLKI